MRYLLNILVALAVIVIPLLCVIPIVLVMAIGSGYGHYRQPLSISWFESLMGFGIPWLALTGLAAVGFSRLWRGDAVVIGLIAAIPYVLLAGLIRLGEGMSGAAVFCGAGIVTSIVYVGASLRHRKQRYMVGEVNMGTAVTDAGLEHLQGRTKVRELYLHRTQVTDAGLAHLQGLTRLVTLDLSRTKITDAGLTRLKGLPQLKSLYLNATAVTDAGVKELAGWTRLQVFSLVDVSVTDAALEHLRGLTRLQAVFSVDGWRHRIPVRGVAHEVLRSFQPSCKIAASPRPLGGHACTTSKLMRGWRRATAQVTQHVTELRGRQRQAGVRRSIIKTNLAAGPVQNPATGKHHAVDIPLTLVRKLGCKDPFVAAPQNPTKSRPREPEAGAPRGAATIGTRRRTGHLPAHPQPMTLPTTDPSLPFQSRRRFLVSAAAGLALWQYGERAFSQVTGRVMPKLAAYDDLMAAFMREHHPPGAALAVTYQGRLVYARGFGYADLENREPVQPASLFRIASLSKPITAAAVMQLVEQGKLRLDDRVFPILKLQPHLGRRSRFDPRWHEITVRHCLQHTGGWDRDKSFDPMAARTAERVATALNVPLPILPEHIIRYTMGKPLDSDPGTAYAYSNFGYCALGRIIEAVSGNLYGEFVRQKVLAPLGIRDMRLGKNLLRDRAAGEVEYYDSRQRSGRAISGPKIGEEVPLPYGVECIETMDANGGWIASAVDLVRFAAALDDPKRCPILSEDSIRTMLALPPGAVGHDPSGRPKATYYACGWNVRPSVRQPGKYTKWHTGMLAGSSTLLVCGDDGINWAALFNSDADKDGKMFAGLIDPLLHAPANEIKDWPEIDLFRRNPVRLP